MSRNNTAFIDRQIFHAFFFRRQWQFSKENKSVSVSYPTQESNFSNQRQFSSVEYHDGSIINSSWRELKPEEGDDLSKNWEDITRRERERKKE